MNILIVDDSAMMRTVLKRVIGLCDVPVGAILWLLAGGLFYTVGVVFFAWTKLRYSHAIWHVFVLAGSICHFIAVLLYIVPPRA